MHIIRYLQILHTHDYNLFANVNRAQIYKKYFILTNKTKKIMILTKLEEKTLTIQDPEALSKLKPKDFCVITIYNLDNTIVCVDKFTTFRKVMKKQPLLYENYDNNFKFLLTYLL